MALRVQRERPAQVEIPEHPAALAAMEAKASPVATSRVPMLRAAHTAAPAAQAARVATAFRREARAATVARVAMGAAPQPASRTPTPPARPQAWQNPSAARAEEAGGDSFLANAVNGDTAGSLNLQQNAVGGDGGIGMFGGRAGGAASSLLIFNTTAKVVTGTSTATGGNSGNNSDYTLGP
jgi:hypothetical protein